MVCHLTVIGENLSVVVRSAIVQVLLTFAIVTHLI